MKRENKGSLSFQTEVSKRTKVVKVTLFQILGGERIKVGVSSSICGVGILSEEEGNVETDIKNARNLLFEEELFHQMTMEARGLASHRVQVVDHKIIINLYDEILEVEYTDINNTNLDIGKSVKYSTRANYICAVFRILLSNLHRRNLQKRRQLPVNIITNDLSKKSGVYILQPLIAHVLHEKIMKRTRKALELLVQTSLGEIDTSKPITIEQESVSPRISGSFPSTKASPNNTATRSTLYLGRLAVQPASNITISIPEKFVIVVAVGSPLQWHAPLYSVLSYQWSSPDRVMSTSGFHDLSDLSDWVKWVFDYRQGN